MPVVSTGVVMAKVNKKNKAEISLKMIMNLKAHKIDLHRNGGISINNIIMLLCVLQI